ncbi:helix-turn-helix domain-containing protein, partial [Escherichia coli]|nr:helix-turn-helix domain-containing protein [Escherichia coli]
MLSKNEMSVLHYLMKHQGYIVSRDELLDYLWDCNAFVDDNTLTVNINRLRKRM